MLLSNECMNVPIGQWFKFLCQLILCDSTSSQSFECFAQFKVQMSKTTACCDCV